MATSCRLHKIFRSVFSKFMFLIWICMVLSKTDLKCYGAYTSSRRYTLVVVTTLH